MQRRFEISRKQSTTAVSEAVERLLLDPATWNEWQPEIVEATGPAPLEEGDVARGSASMLGFKVAGHTTVVGRAEGVFEEDVIVGVRMKLTYRTLPGSRGSEVIQTLIADLPGGVSGRVLSFFLKRRLKRMQRRALDNLARLAESG